MDRWDPNALRLDRAFAGRAVKVSRRKRKMGRRVNGLFLLGPIPMGWLHEAAAQAPPMGEVDPMRGTT